MKNQVEMETDGTEKSFQAPWPIIGMGWDVGLKLKREQSVLNVAVTSSLTYPNRLESQ